MKVESYDFGVDPALRRWARLFAIRPERCTVTLSPTELTVTFGRWSLSTPPTNVDAVEVDGPYRWWKVAGPPRLSLADRGITFGTNAERGVCIGFRDAVGAIDPLHLIRHPNTTVTVADPDRFAAELRRIVAEADPTAPPPADTVDRPHGTLLPTLRALVRWFRRDRSVTVDERAVETVEPPAQPLDIPDAQSFDDGVGARFHRRYRISIGDATMSPTEAMAALQADPNVMTSADFAPFNRISGVAGEMRVGDRFVVQLAGPWDGPVEVVDVTPTSFRLATLTGHMEAGLIEFSVDEVDGALRLTIESWARSGDAGMDALYDGVGISKHLQTEMWVEACEAFAEAVGAGAPLDPVEIVTERADA